MLTNKKPKKTFIPLSTEDTPEKDPTKVITWVNPSTLYPKNPESLEYEPCCPPKEDYKCKKPPKTPTIEEEIREAYSPIIKKHLIAKSKYKKDVKLRCKAEDDYIECVRFLREPHHLKYNAEFREKAFKIRKKLEEVRHDDEEPPKYLVEGKSLIKLQSPTATGKVKLKAASPSCSFDTVFVPSRKILDLHPPKSGVYLNENEIKNADVPFDGYNPRMLQQKADDILPHRLIERDKQYYIKIREDQEPEECDGEEEEEEGGKWWESKGRKCTEPCCCLFFRKTFEDEDEYNLCMRGPPKIYPIADDLEKHFKITTALLGPRRYKREKDDVKKEEEKRRRKSVAALYTAYGATYSTPIDEWEEATIEEILDEGEELHEKSEEWLYTDPESNLDVIPELVDKQLTLKPVLFAEGSLNCFDPNVLKSLNLFFKTGHACILLCDTLYLLIWRMCNGFCVFDPNGRNEDCERDWHTGKAALMKTKPLEHVAHIILNLSDLSAEKLYKLYEIRLVNFGDIPKPIETMIANKKKKYYLVVNKNFAVIPGIVGMLVPEESDEINESLFAALFALIYSRIDPPRHWSRKLIDKLIQLGEKYGTRYLKKMQMEHINANTLPSVLYMGSYRIDVEIKPFMYNGHLSECDNYRYSPLTSSLLQFFTNFRCGILQVDASSMAIWRDSDFYFVLDPFERSLGGKVSEDGETPILQLHITLESVLRVLYRNSVDMKIDGNYFIHPVLIKSITFMSRTQHMLEKAKDSLKITFPVNCDAEIKEEISCSELEPPPKPLPTKVPDECLSLLSVSPCERTCSESEVYAAERKEKARLKKLENLKHADSLESLEDSEKFPEEDSGDIAIPVMEHIICLIIVEIAAQSREKEKEPIKADKVLVKSDLGHLEKLKRTVKRGEDYDNLYAQFPTDIPSEEMIPYEDELRIPTNFYALPDGTSIIKGTTDLKEDDLILGVLGALVAAVLSKKYNISTWDSAIVDFAMSSAEMLKESYKPPNDVFALLLKKKIPQFEIGSKKYQIIVQKLKSGTSDELAKILEGVLTRHKCLILLFSTFSCTVFKRYNFFYLFVGFPCDLMGFRAAENGSPCFFRFREFSSLVHRIDFNRLENTPDQGFIILSIHVKDISPDAKSRFRQSPSYDELLYDQELQEKKRREKRQLEKLAFLDDEIGKEKRRIRTFRELKDQTKKKGTGTEEEEEEEKGEEEEEGDEEQPEKKHKPGRKLDRLGGGYTDKAREQVELGYRLREQDCIFKIQGTNAMESRSGSSNKDIRACYFAAMYAILFASMRPLSRWEFRRIDQVLEKANELFDGIRSKSTACDRKVDNIRVDDYLFNVTVRALDQDDLRKRVKISEAVDSITSTKKYFMLQLPNCTFAIYKDEYWHLFDPYKTLETLKEEKEKDKQKTFVCPKGMKKYPDRNTASWVLFPLKENMLEYIGKRVESPKWKYQYKLHVVDVRSFRKASKNVRLLNFLLKEIFDDEEKPYEDLDCIPEEVKWLESDPIPWTRLNDINIVGDLRGSSLAMWKAFDIEITDELFSLWGTIHPLSAVFKKNRGKQYLATYVVAHCMASTYRVTEWNSAVLDSIVVNGNKYFKQSIEGIKAKDYEFTLEDLNLEFEMNKVHFDIHIESVLIGNLYSRNRGEFNLSAALVYFFMNYKAGIIQCLNKSLAFGKANKGYFLYDCQNYGNPLFPQNEGASYVLLCTTIKSLLYCMVRTLRIPYYNQLFVIHTVEISVDKAEGGEEEGEEEGDEEEEEEETPGGPVARPQEVAAEEE